MKPDAFAAAVQQIANGTAAPAKSRTKKGSAAKEAVEALASKAADKLANEALKKAARKPVAKKPAATQTEALKAIITPEPPKADSTPVASNIAALQEAVAAAQRAVTQAQNELKAAKEALKAAGGIVTVRPSNTQRLKVADPNASRKGTTALYVAKALELKTFTRDELFNAMAADGYEPKAARIKIADCVYFGVFVDEAEVVTNKMAVAF